MSSAPIPRVSMAVSCFRIQLALTALFLAIVSHAGFASASGRTEFNQVVVDAAGGFPLTITEPGNYVLTGPLVVPADTDGFILMTNHVVFDLNGFSISSSATCNTSSCPSGNGMAIRGFSGIAHAHRSTVRNGTIRGFGNSCLRLGSQARVDDLLITECGRNGFSVGGGGVVTNNRVLQVGEYGILMSEFGAPDVFAYNTVVSANLGGGGFTGVRGGEPSAGNSCDDGSCGGTPKYSLRRYYLTPSGSNGANASSACAAGFHFASYFEIADVGNLKYDPTLGLTRDDSGEGPPSSEIGWIRTGQDSEQTASAGSGNCAAWSSTSGSGSLIFLKSGWTSSAGTSLWPFSPLTALCSSSQSVWCVED